MKSGLQILALCSLILALCAKNLLLSEITNLKSQLKDTIDSQKARLKERKLSVANKKHADKELTQHKKQFARADRYLKPVKPRFLKDAGLGKRTHAAKAVPKILAAKPVKNGQFKTSKKDLFGFKNNRGLKGSQKADKKDSKKSNASSHTKTEVAIKAVSTKNAHITKKLVQKNDHKNSNVFLHSEAKAVLNQHQHSQGKVSSVRQMAQNKHAKAQKLKGKSHLHSKRVKKQINKKKAKSKAKIAKGKKSVHKNTKVAKSTSLAKNTRSLTQTAGLHKEDDQLLAALSKKVQALKEQKNQSTQNSANAKLSGTQPVSAAKIDTANSGSSPVQRKLKSGPNKERSLLDLPSQNEFYSQMVEKYSDKF